MSNPVGDFLTVSKLNMQSLVGGYFKSDKIEFMIDGQKIEKWKGLSVKYEMDSPVAAASFLAPYDPYDPAQRELYNPEARRILDINVFGTTILQGRIDKVVPGKSDSGNHVNIEARAIISDTVDCDHIGDIYFKGITLQRFADIVMGNNSAFFDPDTAPIPLIKVERGEKQYEAVAKEAAQRGYWCIPARAGTCTFKKISINDPIQAELEDGVAPLLEIKSAFDASKRFTKYLITGSGNGTGRSIEVEDTEFQRISKTLRTKLVKATRENADLKAFGNRTMNKDQIDFMTLEGSMSSWFFNDDLWQPGGMVTIEAPGAMIYTPSKFIIKSVDLGFDENGETCNLTFALPNAYSGEPLTEKPWVGVPR